MTMNTYTFIHEKTRVKIDNRRKRIKKKVFLPLFGSTLCRKERINTGPQ